MYHVFITISVTVFKIKPIEIEMDSSNNLMGKVI